MFSKGSLLALALCGSVALAAASLAGRPVDPASAGEVPTLGIGSASLEVGAEAALDVVAGAIAPPGLGAWTVDVVHDPAITSISACTPYPGSFCNPDLGGTGDRVRLIGADANGLTGDVTLGAITFHCEAEGVSSLTVEVVTFADATPLYPQTIEPTVTNGSVTCALPPTPTSEATVTPTQEPPATPTEPAPTATQPPAPSPTDEPGPTPTSDVAGVILAPGTGTPAPNTTSTVPDWATAALLGSAALGVAGAVRLAWRRSR